MTSTEHFDAVGFMREARDRLSREMQGMTPSEQIDLVRAKACDTASGQNAESFVARDRKPDA